MYKEAFEIATLHQESPGRWSVGGRAYVDINLNDDLTLSGKDDLCVRVVGIVTYGKNTDLLSTMMTGTLLVEGDIESRPAFLYAKVLT